MDKEDIFISAALAACVILIILCIFGMVASAKAFEEFKAEHNCKAVAKVSGDIFNTYSVGANSQMQIGIASTPDKTGWLCDDGVTYYR